MAFQPEQFQHFQPHAQQAAQSAYHGAMQQHGVESIANAVAMHAARTAERAAIHGSYVPQVPGLPGSLR